MKSLSVWYWLHVELAATSSCARLLSYLFRPPPSFPFTTSLHHTHTLKITQEWAAEEAETRLARIEDGKDVEYGRIYHKQLLTGGFVEHSAVNADNPPEEREGEEEEEE